MFFLYLSVMYFFVVFFLFFFCLCVFFFLLFCFFFFCVFFFQAEDGIRDFCLSRGLGDVYKRQVYVPHGLWVNAFTTIIASTARMITMIIKVATSAITPAVAPISSFTSSPSERPSRRVETNNTLKFLTAPASTTPPRIFLL